MTYAVLLAPVLAAAIVAVVVALRRRRRSWAALAIAAAILLALTIVFDTVMIAADLFRYDDALLLGARIGLAPIEDLAYALIALFVVVALWRLLPSRIRSSSAARSSWSSRARATGDAGPRPAGPADA
ncbi:MAG: lycopene cyclase domain-containing protein [Actinomycetota bacterium]